MKTAQMRIHILAITTIHATDLPSTTVNGITTDHGAARRVMRKTIRAWQKRKVCDVVHDSDVKFVADLNKGMRVSIDLISHTVPCEVTI